MEKMLIVGLGSIGRRHTGQFMKYFDQIDIVDINPERILQAEKEYKINKSFNDYKDALNNNNYDAVAITAPPHLHLPIAKLAASKKVNLFIEKPLGMNTDGWKEVKELSEKNNLIVYVAYCHRHIKYSERLKEIIDSNLLGRPIHANMRWGSYLPDWHPWEDYRDFYMAKKEQGGGALMDESHGIDLARYILGDVKEVFGIVDTISDLEINSDDAAFLTLRMKNNALVHINFDLAARSPRVNFEIVCVKGTVIWDRVDHKIKIFNSNDNKWVVEEYNKDDLLNMYDKQSKHFVECISKKIEPKINLDDAIKTQAVIDGAFESSQSKKLINII
jgi:predicted dehydrogenase